MDDLFLFECHDPTLYLFGSGTNFPERGEVGVWVQR